MERLRTGFIFLTLAGLLGTGAAGVASTAGNVDPTCEVATSSTLGLAALDAATQTRAGVGYDRRGLGLHHAGGQWSLAPLGIADGVAIGCAADFDGDGWPDIVATDRLGALMVYQNRTFESPAPDWTDPTRARAPRFVPSTVIESSNGQSGDGSMLCGDLDGDGRMDFILVRCGAGQPSCTTPARADMFLGNGDGTFRSPVQAVPSLSALGPLHRGGTRFALVDENGDGKKDLLAGVLGPEGDSGQVIAFLSDGRRFTTPVVLLDRLGLGVDGVNALVAGDFTNDGVLDLGVSGDDSQVFQIYPGLRGGGFAQPQNLPGFPGGAVAAFASDFGRQGRLDLVVGTAYWTNGGTQAPFAASGLSLAAPMRPDASFALDYDQDPDHTLDVVVGSSVLVNRVAPTYVDCGTVASDTLDIGSLAEKDLTITDVRIAPTPSTPAAGDGTIGWDASNDGGRSWHAAPVCADDPGAYCASFGATAGKQVRWRATMCSNTTGAPHTRTPVLERVTTTYTYVTAQNHFRAGPIAQDGIVYAGAFREPGDWGHVYAIEDRTGRTLWDASDVLDATPASSRHIYTVAADGTPLVFAASNTANDKLQATLLAGSEAVAEQIVAWATSARFGLGQAHVLGSVESSTPALLIPPRPPTWYPLQATSVYERSLIDVFNAAELGRQRLLFVGAKDGMLHAFDSDGHEVWAFVPHDVAQRMLADRTAGTITAYPDGSPTLANAKVYANWRTVLVMSEGNGGRSVFALDVTDTTPNGTVTGPTPLWRFSDPAMGATTSKPTVIRTRVRGAETWMAVFASGPGAAGQGGVVYALDLSTGRLLWKFDVGDPAAYVSSDVTATWTQGFVDRLFFADSKGRIWKVDPAAARDGVMDSIGSRVDVGLAHKALFSTELTAGALGTERAIAGALTATSDGTNHPVLYFGTGGTDDTPAGAQNGFFAVHADSGLVRSKLDGVAAGVKFTGGLVYQSGQLVFATGQDGGGQGLCAPSEGSIVALDAATFARQFVTPTRSKIVAPLFAQGGEIYAVTLTGQLVASAYMGSGPPITALSWRP